MNLPYYTRGESLDHFNEWLQSVINSSRLASTIATENPSVSIFSVYNELAGLKRAAVARSAALSASAASNVAPRTVTIAPVVTVPVAVTPTLPPGAQPGTPPSLFDWDAWRAWLAVHTESERALQNARAKAATTAQIEAEEHRQNENKKPLDVNVTRKNTVSGMKTLRVEDEANPLPRPMDFEMDNVLRGMSRDGLTVSTLPRFQARKLLK